jgi:hypothetical protein
MGSPECELESLWGAIHEHVEMHSHRGEHEHITQFGEHIVNTLSFSADEKPTDKPVTFFNLLHQFSFADD